MKPSALIRLAMVSIMLLSVFLFSCEQMPAVPSTSAQVPAAGVNAQLVKAVATDSGTVATDKLITFYSGLNNPYFIAGAENESYLYLEAKAAKYVPPANMQRTPLNISLVIDRSGSMAGDKIDYVRRAANFVVDNLGSEDVFSIVIYDDAIETLVSPGRLQDKTLVKSKISSIFSRGSTNLCGGMQEGYEQVKKNYKSGYVNRVLLLTDGLANQGIVEPERIMQIARNMNLEHGITISTFGVGADFNENLLTGIAEYGSGNYYFIDSPDEIPQIFEKELKGLLAVVAQNMKLTITLEQSVTVRQVFGYKYEQTGNKVTIAFRDVYSEETKAVLLKVSVPGNAQSTVALKAKLEYDDASDAFKHKILETTSIVTATTNKAMQEKSYSERVMQQVTLFESNDLLERAMKAVDDGEYDKARDYVYQNDGYLKKQFESITPTEELLKQESANTTYKVKIEDVESMSEYDRKMMQKGEKSDNYEIRKKKE